MSRAERRAVQRASEVKSAERQIPGGQANALASMLLVTYGDPDWKRTPGPSHIARNEQEALDRLKKLEGDISQGTVNTYREVGNIVGSLSLEWLDTAGGRTAAIDQAAARVYIAVHKTKSTFADSDPNSLEE